MIDILAETNLRFVNLEKTSGDHPLNNNEVRLTDKQIEEIKSTWENIKKG